jgi:hypothetical protein
MPEPISTPEVTSVALPSAFKFTVAAAGPVKTNQVPTVVACPYKRPSSGMLAGLASRSACILSSIGPGTLP